jgi:hypothetical protein
VAPDDGDETPDGAGGPMDPVGDVAGLGMGAYSLTIPLLGRTSNEGPDPERAKLRARLAEQRKTGEWDDWFIELPEKQDQFAAYVGFPLQRRQIAAKNLRKLYEAKVCKRLLKHPENRHIVEPLFDRWLPHLLPLLRVGVLLEALGKWPTDKIIDDLQSAEGFAGGFTELEVWASLSKAGYDVHREPLGPGGKRPDFGVNTGGKRHIIEVKTLLRSDGERFAEHLRSDMAVIATRLSREGYAAKVSATSIVRDHLLTVEGRARIKGDDGGAALELLQQECIRLDREGLPVGTHVVGDWFTIDVRRDTEYPLGVVRCGVWDGQETDRRAVRLATVVEGALEQISPSDVGVVVVEVGEPIDVQVVTDTLSLRTAERPVFFSTLSFVVLRWKLNARMRLIPTGAILPHGGSLTRAAEKLGRVLIGDAS